VKKVAGQLRELIDHLRSAIEKIDEPRSKAMFETSAEVLGGPILKLAPQSGAPGDARQPLIDTMRLFIAMYRPHEAREDTVLFPKLRAVVSANEFDAMAEDFENDEHRKFGEDGFEMMVDRVAGLKRALGVYDLAKFTPHRS
jgi:Hemerythrin HHE cation binding domain